MIPDPSYPTYESANRAMQMSDAFVQQARMQAQAQMYQQQMAFTGGQGGGQPGIMAYAAGAGQRFMGGMASGIGGQMSQFMGGLGTAAGVGAVVAQPMFGQVGNVLEGSRYTGAGARDSFTSLLATAYAPLSLFPQAGTALGMEQGLRRQTAREEANRRLTQAGRGAAVALGDSFTLGLGSYFMRRSGADVAYLGEQERERTLQQRMGFLRGEEFGGSEGMGAGRGYFTRGAGRGVMAGVRAAERGLQSSFGLSREQLDNIRGISAGAVDVTRIQQAGAGGKRGQDALGEEIGNIERSFAALARTMQLSGAELGRLSESMKGVMKVTAESNRTFLADAQRVSSAGPFSAAQVGQFQVQAMGAGQQMFMNAPSFASDAMRQAQQVSEFRRSGTIAASTLLREGGGLDPDAMMRMTMARIQQQAGLVQGGNFNQSLLLASQNKGAFGAMMGGGASFFQTQGAAAAAMIANPWAMLQARMDPAAAQRVTMAAPAIAFMQSQQRDTFMLGNDEQKRVQKIASFGRQMGMDMTTAQGAANAKIRYEEMEDTQGAIKERLSGAGMSTKGLSEAEKAKMGKVLFGFSAQTGISGDEAVNALEMVMSDDNLNRELGQAKTSEEKNNVLKRGLAASRASDSRGVVRNARYNLDKIAKSVISPGRFKERLEAEARTLEKAGVSDEDIIGTLFGGAQEGWNEDSKRISKIQSAGGGKFERIVRNLNVSSRKVGEITEEYRKKNKGATQTDAMMAWARKEALAGRTPWKEERLEVPFDEGFIKNWRAARGRGGEASSYEEEDRRELGEIEWGERKGGLSGVLGVLTEAGVKTEGKWEDVAAGFTDIDKKIAGDKRLAPLLKVVKQLEGGNFNDIQLSDAADKRTLRNYFKHWAVTDSGKEVMKGIDASKLEGGTMQAIYSNQMTPAQRKDLGQSLLFSALEKSSRTMSKEDRGTFGTPLWVLIKDKPEAYVAGEGKK